MNLPSELSNILYPKSKLPQYFREFSLSILFILIGVDLIFMAIHALKSLGLINNSNFSVTQNWGYPEFFQYLKATFLTGCFLWLGVKYRRPQLYCWAIIFLYVLVDDSLEIHEHLGYHTGALLENIGIAGGKTLGELLIFGLLGLIIFAPLFFFYFNRNHRNLKIMSQDLFMLFVVMLVFGIAVDILHDMTAVGTVLNGALGLLEDGGEMVAMSAMVWYVLTLTKMDNFLEETKPKTIAKWSPHGRKIQKDRPALIRPRKAKKLKRLG